MAGFSYKFYQQIESGRKKQIWMKTVERLASAYNLQIWELLAPTLPSKTQLTGVVLESKIHYGQKKKRPAKIAIKRPAPERKKKKNPRAKEPRSVINSRQYTDRNYSRKNRLKSTNASRIEQHP